MLNLSFAAILPFFSFCRDQDIFPLPQPSPRNKSRKHTEALQKLRCWVGDFGCGEEGQFERIFNLSCPNVLSIPREVNKRLQDLRSCLSPKQHQRPALQNIDDEVVLVEGSVSPQSPRLFTLKIRCRADLVRLPVRTVSTWNQLGQDQYLSLERRVLKW